MKLCLICKETKSLEEFYRDYSTKDKRNRRCKPCWKAYMGAPHRVEAHGRYVESYMQNPSWVRRQQEYGRVYRAKKKLEKLEWQKAMEAKCEKLT